MRSTFAGFTTARLAMRASQKALNVTGQNIANINTAGYTRQRLDLVSLHNGQGMERYQSNYTVSIGNGVLATGVSQIRDPFLDIRFRNEISNVGGAEQKAEILKDLENIFDEVSKNGIQNQISDIGTMLQKLSDNVGNQEFDNMVKASADVLTKMLNQYANQLETIKSDQIYNLEKVDIPAVNDILKNIQSLNESIKTNHVYGNAALELIDQRNMLIDELASYMDIEVKMNKVPVSGDPNGRHIEIMQIKLKGTNISLIDDNQAAKLGLATEPVDPADPAAGTKTKMPYGLELSGIPTRKTDGSFDTPTTIADINAYAANPGDPEISLLKNGVMKSTLDMMNLKGEFDGSSVRGVGYYEESLNLFANQVADTFNKINNRVNGTLDPSDSGYVKYDLFESNNGGPITAKNIKISDAWIKGDVKINPAKDGSTTGKNDNILAMIDSLKSKKDYTAANGNKIFNGTFQEYFTNVGSVLGLDIKSTDSLLDNYTTVATDIANMRDNISRVSLDEEGMNILHYQKSYNAAARLMTALDEAIGTIISNMGVVGR